MLLEEEEEEEEERACLWKDREEGWIWNSDTATATDTRFAKSTKIPHRKQVFKQTSRVQEEKEKEEEEEFSKWTKNDIRGNVKGKPKKDRTLLRLQAQRGT
ncbi:hypothetical protein HZH66_007156 [Vespula vulgaris]|uniref:Uncharacterized protein n=1 Tax=Vespula vulgaris TaxID=7454 RepID=A0A834JX19_VESVU|nr:hypothetical protein HZH66_007156 [Vespula vulgaris]